jgi:Na+-driven multidrug efflux pump
MTFGQWEFLGVVFARVLGPAELVSWILLGYVWYLIKYLVDGLADSAQLRCCHWLISNQPLMAQTSSQKAHFLGLSLSVLLISVLFMTGKDLLEWMTQDLVLQTMMIETLPLVGLGVVVETVSLVSLAVLGAQQDRVRLSHFVQFMGTWMVTLILSAVFCFVLRIDLQGLTAAVVLGLAISGAGQAYLLMKSDWINIAAMMSKGLVLPSQAGDGGDGDVPSHLSSHATESKKTLQPVKNKSKGGDEDADMKIIIYESSSSSSENEE